MSYLGPSTNCSHYPDPYYHSECIKLVEVKNHVNSYYNWPCIPIHEVLDELVGSNLMQVQ